VKEMSLDLIQGKWNDTFYMMYNFKARVEKTSFESVIKIEYEFAKERVNTLGGRSIR
jgi:hypothetical protein